MKEQGSTMEPDAERFVAWLKEFEESKQHHARVNGLENYSKYEVSNIIES
jgi:hypothetical protein